METVEFKKIIHTIQELFDPQAFHMDEDVSATADSFSKPTIVRGTNVSLWAKTTGATIGAAKPKVSLQGCNFESTTDADWVDLLDSEIEIDTDAVAEGSALIACCYKYVRRKYLKGDTTNSGGGSIIAKFDTWINVNR